MKRSDVFPSKYLSAEEIDEDLTLTIKKVVLETLKDKEGKEQPKPIMYFEEIEKGMVFNKTNWGLTAKQHGDDSDDWTGKQVTLTIVTVDAFGDVVDAIRIKPQRKTAPVKTEAKSNGTSTAYWTKVNEIGLDKATALKILANVGGNFQMALEAITPTESEPASA